MRSHSEIQGVRTQTYLLGGHNSTHDKRIGIEQKEGYMEDKKSKNKEAEVNKISGPDSGDRAPGFSAHALPDSGCSAFKEGSEPSSESLRDGCLAD